MGQVNKTVISAQQVSIWVGFIKGRELGFWHYLSFVK